MELVAMDERQLSPMQFASFLLPALTVRALQAPTVRAEVYHTLVEAFVKRLWPDMWEAILGAFCRVHLQPAEFRTLMQVPGTLARWIREESGLQVVEFNPPRINNLSRLQEILDLEREESLEVLSRHSMPNVDYEENEVISNEEFRRGNRYTMDNAGAQVRIDPRLPVARRLAMEDVPPESHANTQDGGEPPAPAIAEVVEVAEINRRWPSNHMMAAYRTIDQLVEGCRTSGPTVLPAASHLLRNFNTELLELAPLDLTQVPDSPPLQFVSTELQQTIQEATYLNDDLYGTLLLQVLRPFVQTHLPLACWMIMHHLGVNTAREAVQIASVSSQLVRRIRELDLQVVSLKPPQPEVEIDQVLQLETEEGFRMVLVLQTEICQNESHECFFDAMRAWLASLYPHQRGEISQIYHVMPNFSETPYPSTMAGKDRPLRFRAEISFNYQEFLAIDSEVSPLRAQWKELVARHTNGLKIIAHFEQSCSVVAYLPGVFPEHGLNEIKAMILAYPTLLAEGEGLHIDWDSIPWMDGQETVWIRIAKVVVHQNSVQMSLECFRILLSGIRSWLSVPFWLLSCTPHSFKITFEATFMRQLRVKLLQEVLSQVWADPHEVHISERIAGHPLQPWQLSFTVAEYILSKSDEPGEELFDRSIFTQIVMGPKKGEISFVVTPGMMKVAWDQRYWLDRVIMGSYPTVTTPIQWTSDSPSMIPPEAGDGPPTPIPTHGFETKLDDQDQDSVETEEAYSVATSLKAPPDVIRQAEAGGDRVSPTAEAGDEINTPQLHDLTPTRELVIALLHEIRDLKIYNQKREEELACVMKELMSKQEVTTQSLTSLGNEITVLTNGAASPDNVSGLTGSSQTTFTRAIILAINEAIKAAYSPGGIVSSQCEEDANMTNEQFALMIRENVLDGIFPEIQDTIITSIRDQTEAMTRLIAHPGRFQAGEIAKVVKEHLAPSMNAMSEGLLRLATTVELALNAPAHSTMGSIAHDVSPTYELLKDTRNAIRLLGGRMASGLDYMQKVGFEIMEFLSRERRIGASHEMAVRKYLKSIKVVTELVQVAVETEDPGESHSFTNAILRCMSLVKSAQAEFENYFSGHTNPTPPLADSVQDGSGTPLSPSNTFYNPGQNIYGNLHEEKGVDQTLSEAMEHYDGQHRLHEESSGNNSNQNPTEEDPVASRKDPPEQIYPSLMMRAECAPVTSNSPTEEQLVVVATMASQGQIVIAEPVAEEDDEEEQLEVAKALSLSEFHSDERKPAAAQQKQNTSNEITPVKESTELTQAQVEQLGADPLQAYTANAKDSQDDAILNLLAETDSEDGSKSVSIYCRASNMRDVSNLSFPTGIGQDPEESGGEESATVTDKMSPRRTRSRSKRDSTSDPVWEE
jgi:hypothetical protein